MKITYRIEQYDVDDFIIVITSPEYLVGLHTRIHTPHFLLSELQQNIKTNLNQTIRRFCIKHKQYADILHNEAFEFEPDKHDKYDEHDNSCWFYTGKFIDDTERELSDEEKNTIHYKNYHRYTSQTRPVCKIMVNRGNTDGLIVFQKTTKNEVIDANKLTINFGIPKSEIKFWNRLQRAKCSTEGNNYGDVYFPRYEKNGGKNIYTIRQINIFFELLFKNNKPKYDSLVNYLKKYHHRAFEKTRIKPTVCVKF